MKMNLESFRSYRNHAWSADPGGYQDPPYTAPALQE